ARQWLKATTAFAVGNRVMPAPPWDARGFDDPPAAAWETIGREVAARDRTAPLSAYVHIPFCDRKCAFCDCYALYMDPDNRRREGQYIDALLREADAWSALGPFLSDSPVTTVHFGGGTPNYTSPERFAHVLAALRQFLHVTDATEWALESTSTELTPDH